jgi:hypothetical protein
MRNIAGFSRVRSKAAPLQAPGDGDAYGTSREPSAFKSPGQTRDVSK